MWCPRCHASCLVNALPWQTLHAASGAGAPQHSRAYRCCRRPAKKPNVLVRGAGHEEDDLSARYLSMPLPLGGSASGRRRALSADMATAHVAASRRGSWPVPPGLPSGAQLPL